MARSRAAPRSSTTTSRRPAPPPARGTSSAAPVQQRAASTSTAPAHVASAPPPAMASSGGGGGLMSSIGSTIVQGMAFGTGSAIAHRAVGAVADSFSGSSHDAPAAAAPAAPAASMAGGSNPCELESQRFSRCVEENGGQLSACQHLFDSLQQCKLDFQAPR